MDIAREISDIERQLRDKEGLLQRGVDSLPDKGKRIRDQMTDLRNREEVLKEIESGDGDAVGFRRAQHTGTYSGEEECYGEDYREDYQPTDGGG